MLTQPLPSLALPCKGQEWLFQGCGWKKSQSLLFLGAFLFLKTAEEHFWGLSFL